jgi:uncharacterized membrane protein
LLVGLLVVLTISLALSSAGQRWSGDLPLYRDYSAVLLGGTLTHTDFLDWYPAIALGPMVLPHLLNVGQPVSLPVYALVFALLTASSAAATSVLAGRIGKILDEGLSTRAAVICAAFVLLLAPVVVFRYDIVPALFAGAGLLAVLAGWPILAGLAIGISAGLKIYAVVIAAVVVIWTWAGRDWRALGRFVVGGAAAATVALVPYLVLTPSNPLGPIAFNTGRPLQLESIGGGIVSLLRLGEPLAITFDYGSFNLTGAVADSVARLLPPAQLVAILALLGCAAYRFIRDVRAGASRAASLVTASLAITLGLILTSKVLSPQYLVWLLPFLPVLAARSRRVLWLAVTTLALTLLIFPVAYGALLAQQPLMVVILNIRNLLLVAMFGLVVSDLVRGEVREPLQASGPRGRFSAAPTQLSPKSTVGP